MRAHRRDDRQGSGGALDIQTGELANAAAVPPAHGQLCAVAQYYEYRASEALVHFQYALDVDDGGAVDAQELAAVEPLFDVADRFAHEGGRGARAGAGGVT